MRRRLLRVSVALSIVLACSSSPNGPDGGGRPVDAGRVGDNTDANDQRAGDADADDQRAGDANASDVSVDVDDAMDGNGCFAPGREGPERDFLFLWQPSDPFTEMDAFGSAQRTITVSSDTLNIFVLAVANITLSAGALHDGTYTCGASDGGRDSASVMFDNGAGTPYEDCTITLSFTADGDGCPRALGTFSAGHLVDGGAALNGSFNVPLH
jgi:hypothetical protein